MTDLKALQPLLGNWKTSGEVIGEGRISGVDNYELLAGLPWILHTADVAMPDGHVRVYELIGGVHPRGGWSMHAFDESGQQPTLMQLTAEPDGQLLVSGDGVRSRLTVGPDSMEALWERQVEGEWVLGMSMRFDRG